LLLLSFGLFLSLKEIKTKTKQTKFSLDLAIPTVPSSHQGKSDHYGVQGHIQRQPNGQQATASSVALVTVFALIDRALALPVGLQPKQTWAEI